MLNWSATYHWEPHPAGPYQWAPRWGQGVGPGPPSSGPGPASGPRCPSPRLPARPPGAGSPGPAPSARPSSQRLASSMPVSRRCKNYATKADRMSKELIIVVHWAHLFRDSELNKSGLGVPVPGSVDSGVRRTPNKVSCKSSISVAKKPQLPGFVFSLLESEFNKILALKKIHSSPSGHNSALRRQPIKAAYGRRSSESVCVLSNPTQRASNRDILEGVHVK